MSSQQTKFGGVHRASTATSTKEASRSGPINIEVGGQQLSIRSDRGAEFVHQLAHYIEEKLEELQKAAPMAPMNKLVILASLTVAGELFETREELQQIRHQLNETTQSMFELIDQAEEV